MALSSEGEWKEARRDILTAVRAAVSGERCPEGERAAEHYEKVVAAAASKEKKKKRTLFIVDDNNYYRSMRQEYHKLARDAGAGFCQLAAAPRYAAAGSRQQAGRWKV